MGEESPLLRSAYRVDNTAIHGHCVTSRSNRPCAAMDGLLRSAYRVDHTSRAIHGHCVTSGQKGPVQPVQRSNDTQYTSSLRVYACDCIAAVGYGRLSVDAYRAVAIMMMLGIYLHIWARRYARPSI